MPAIATDTFRISNVLKYEVLPEHEHCRDAVVVNEAAAVDYVVGTVLGKITASGKYQIAVETATDGSEVPAAVVLDDYSIAETTDTKVKVLARGAAGVSKAGLVLDATYNDAPKKATAYAALEALGIKVLDAV